MPMIPSEDDLIGAMRQSIRELDMALGPRVSAMVVSGAMSPPRRGVATQEGPQFLTSRVFVAPMLRILGYSDVTLIARAMDRLPGLAVSMTAVNCPLSDPVRDLMDVMRRDGMSLGYATDGVRWAKGEWDGEKARITAVSDLSGYYIEVLDRMRFRVSVEADRAELNRFAEEFSKDGFRA